MNGASRFELADAPPAASFDDFALLAGQICRTPFALVTLLDDERQICPGSLGIDLPALPVDQSLCRIGFDDTDLLVIPDLATDPRTAGHPIRRMAPTMRFYAGAIVVASTGQRLGRVCVLDTKAHDGLSEGERTALAALARQVALQVELRRAARENEERALLQTALADISQGLRDGTDVDEMARVASMAVGQVLGANRTGFGRVDPDAETVTYGGGWTTPGTTGLAGTYRFRDFGDLRSPLVLGEPLVIDDVDTDPRTAADPAPMHALEIGALVNMPVRQQGRTVAVLMVQTHAARRWTPAELTFLRAVADRLETGVARVIAEQQQQALNGEIAHRLKNTLAMAQAIASQTLRDVPDRAAVQSFERRLLALGTAHDVLTESNWRAADVGSIAMAALAGFTDGGQLTIAGPAIVIGPRSAMSLSLLLHELATNAVKYGALSVADGRVELHWDDDGHHLTLRWGESKGPPVAVPTRRGFGSRLIRLGLTGTGGVDIRHEPSGLQAEMTASLDELAQS